MPTKIARHAGITAVLGFLLILVVLVTAFSCSTQRQLTPAHPHSEGAAYTPAMLTERHDSVVVQPAPSVLDKLLGRTPAPFVVATVPARIGKKSTINVYNAPATVTTLGKNATAAVGAGASTIQTGKKSGDIIKADSGAIVSKVAGPGNNQVTRGNNNAPQLSAPVQEASDWRAELAKPAGEVAASAVGLLLVAGLVWAVIAYKRRKALSPNQA
jgi:Na+-transporting methylmalonyl-CoA/oxaloacetate decarboxylase gamma subunit